MITGPIRDELKAGGCSTGSLRSGQQIRAPPRYGAFSFPLFDERTSRRSPPEFSGERWSGKKPLWRGAGPQARGSAAGTEAALAKLADQIARARPQGSGQDGRGIGRIENRYKLASCFDMRRRRRASPLAAPGHHRRRNAIDAFMHPHQRRDKSWRPRAWSAPIRSCRSSAPSTLRLDLHLRPITLVASRVRAHVFLCSSPACEWHMRECLKPLR